MVSFGTQVVVDDDLMDYEVNPAFAHCLLGGSKAAKAEHPKPKVPLFIQDGPRPAAKTMFLSSWGPSSGASAKPVEPPEPWFQILGIV